MTMISASDCVARHFKQVYGRNAPAAPVSPVMLRLVLDARRDALREAAKIAQRKRLDPATKAACILALIEGGPR